MLAVFQSLWICAENGISILFDFKARAHAQKFRYIWDRKKTLVCTILKLDLRLIHVHAISVVRAYAQKMIFQFCCVWNLVRMRKNIGSFNHRRSHQFVLLSQFWLLTGWLNPRYFSGLCICAQDRIIPFQSLCACAQSFERITTLEIISLYPSALRDR